jgi:hypothetical protein
MTDPAVTREHYLAACRDAMALLQSAYRGDQEACHQMLGTYDNPYEAGQLLAAMAHMAVNVIYAASMASGISPDSLLSVVVEELMRAEA